MIEYREAYINKIVDKWVPIRDFCLQHPCWKSISKQQRKGQKSQSHYEPNSLLDY